MGSNIMRCTCEWISDKYNTWIGYRIRSGLRRIMRFYAWFPVIWKDEDWDSAYLFEIMRFKIQRIRKVIGKYKRHTTWKRDFKNMKIAENLLDRVAFGSFYHDNFFDNDYWGKQICTCEKNSFFKKDNEWNSSYINYPRCSFCKAYMKLNFKNKKEDADFKILMDLLYRQSRRWWD